MVSLTLIALGKLKEDYFRQCAAEYEKRLSAFCRLNTVEIPPTPLSRNPSPAEIKAALEKEAGLITAKTPKGFKVALCAEGERFTSEVFAKRLSALEHAPSFIIGSSEGLADVVKDGADMKLSLSDMTLPYQLARIMLLEQLYRAYSILNNAKYHK